MSVEQQTILNLQQRLHEENQRRFEQIEEKQNKQDSILQQILSNTQDLPQLKKDVEDLKDGQSRIKGGGAVITFIIGSWEAVRFFWHGH